MLDDVNRGDDAAARRDRAAINHTHRHDAHGNPVGAPLVDRGLTNRRRQEQEQFDRPDRPSLLPGQGTVR